MLTKEDNQLLARVGPGTPMGNLFRQYWLPFLFARRVGAAFWGRRTSSTAGTLLSGFSIGAGEIFAQMV